MNIQWCTNNTQRKKMYTLKYNTKGSDNICLAELKFHIIVDFNYYSSNFGPRFYKFIAKFPNMKYRYYSVPYFKNAIKNYH